MHQVIRPDLYSFQTRAHKARELVSSFGASTERLALEGYTYCVYRVRKHQSNQALMQ